MVLTITPTYRSALNFRRLLALFVLLCCFGTTQQIWAQTCDISHISPPPSITIDLDATPTGTDPNNPSSSATGILDENDVSGFITSSGVTCDVYSFYFGAAQTPVSQLCHLDAPDNQVVYFDCDDIDGLSNTCDILDPDGNPDNNRTGFYIFWVSIGDGVNPANESDLVRINIRLRERTDPVVTCPESFTVAAPNCAGANVPVNVPGFDDNHYEDNCEVVQVERIITTPSGVVIDTCEAHENTYGCATVVPLANVLNIPLTTESLEVGVNTVEFLTVDEHGNEGTCQFTITVAPPAPSVTCTDLHNATLATNGEAIVNASALATDAHDPCGVGIGNYYALRAVAGAGIPNPATFGSTTALFNCADIGQEIDVYIISETNEAVAADRRRSEPCLAKVTVRDPYAPTITCPADIVIDACGDVATALLPANAGMPNISNSLGCTANVVVQPHSDSIDPTSIIGQNCYTIIRKWKAVNTTNGMADSCLQRITLRDFIDPEFAAFPPNRAIACGTTILPENVTGTDNCNNDVFIELIDSTSTQNQSLGNCFAHNFQVTRTWQVTDRCGNYATRSQTVFVRDRQAPVFTSIHPNIDISLSSSNNTVPDEDVYEADIPLYIDASSDCSAHVTLFPVIDDCASDDFLDIDYILYDANDNILLAGSYSPNGGGLILTNLNQGEIYRLELSAQDPCLNSSTLSILIVVGSQQPIAACDDNIIVDLNNLGIGQLRAIDVDEGSSDLCNEMVGCSGSISGTPVNPGIEFMRIRRLAPNATNYTGDCNDFLQAFGCNDIGNLVPVELEVTNFAGQRNTCVAEVLVRTGAYNGFTTNTSVTEASSSAANDGAITITITGGVGPYDYAYTGPTAATILNQGSPYTINNLGVGTYNITVTDNNGCATTINPITIVADAPVNFVSNCPQAAPNATVNVPIRVSSFMTINSVDFTITLNGPAGSLINSVTLNNLSPNLNNSNILAGGQQATFNWFDSSTNGVTLPNGSSIVTVGIFIPAGSGGGTYSLTIDGSQTAVNVTQNQGPGPAASTPITVNFASPICTGGIINNPGVVNGDINFFSNAGVGVNSVKVNVQVGGTLSAVESTNANGMYSVSGLPSGSNTILTPKRAHATQMQLLHGVNGGDLVQVQRFLLSLSSSLTNNAPKVIAADANGNNTIDGGDLVRLQRCILGLETSFAVPSWRFIPSTQTFANPNNPWLAPGFAESITISNVNGTHTANFIGIKVGDTDCSGTGPFPVLGEDDEQFSSTVIEERSTAFSFLVDDQEVKKGKEFEVVFRAKDFRDILMYQTTIQFETNALSLVDAWSNDNLNNLTEDNFGFGFVEEGAVTTVWYNASEESVEDDAALFTLKFKALEDVSSLTNLIHLASTRTEHLAMDEKSNVVGFNIDFGQIVTPTHPDIVLYQNNPNPFSQETVIGFDLPEAGKASLSILDLNGKVVLRKAGNFNKGYNEINIDRNDLTGQSILIYQVQTEKHTATKKMILLD